MIKLHYKFCYIKVQSIYLGGTSDKRNESIISSNGYLYLTWNKYMSDKAKKVFYYCIHDITQFHLQLIQSKAHL